MKRMSCHIYFSSQNISFVCLVFFSYAQSVGAMYFETSAKNNIGIEDVFLNLTNMVSKDFILKFQIYSTNLLRVQQSIDWNIPSLSLSFLFYLDDSSVWRKKPRKCIKSIIFHSTIKFNYCGRRWKWWRYWKWTTTFVKLTVLWQRIMAKWLCINFITDQMLTVSKIQNIL